MFHQLTKNCLKNFGRRNLDFYSIFHLKSRDLALLSTSTRFSSALDHNESRYEKSLFTKISDKKDVKPKGDPDKFGTLSKRFKVEKEMDSMPDEDDDIVVKNFVGDKIGRTRLSTKQYADIIKKHLADKKLTEAIDVLEVQMIKEDRVQPENYIYNLLIDGCAKAGYSKMAFKLYNDMKKRDLKVTGATYTSLFNACALSPVPGDGLKRALHLQQILVEKGVELNRSNYHSMMKAFGRCGDLVTVFNIVDQMASKGVPLKPITFCFLLQACISDKKNGFRHAIMVWQKMRERGVIPTIYCYNLMLRCARDCHLEDPEKLLHDVCLDNPNKEHRDIKLLETGKIDDDCKAVMNVDNVMHIPATLPNLLSTKPQMGTLVSLRPITKPKDRLMLLGGRENIFKQMKLDEVEPDIKTAILLIDLIPSSNQAEMELIQSLEELKISLDVDFCNTLIRKRCMRQDHRSAKEVLHLLTKYKLSPNLMTFGVLSMACRTSKETRQFLEDLNSAGIRPNIEILGGLLCAARHTWNVNIIILLMDIVLKEEIKVSELFMGHLNKFKEFTERQIELKSQNMPYNEKIDNKQFMNSYKKFELKYNMWLKVVDMETRDTIHPWKQYKKSSAFGSS